MSFLDERAPRRAWECRCDTCVIGFTAHDVCERCQATIGGGSSWTRVIPVQSPSAARTTEWLCEACYLIASPYPIRS